MAPELLLKSSEGERIKVERERTTLGRSRDADIFIPDQCPTLTPAIPTSTRRAECWLVTCKEARLSPSEIFGPRRAAAS